MDIRNLSGVLSEKEVREGLLALARRREENALHIKKLGHCECCGAPDNKKHCWDCVTLIAGNALAA